jgi:hypothetical protein
MNISQDLKAINFKIQWILLSKTSFDVRLIPFKTVWSFVLQTTIQVVSSLKLFD